MAQATPQKPARGSLAAKSKSAASLRVGPAGWSYADWNGYVYPTRKPKGFHEAAYLAQFFDTIEINTSFYQPLRPDHAAGWIERVSANPNFVFTAKMWQKFTHDPGATLEDEKAVRAGFDVLRTAEKLGGVLLQFPFSFHCETETKAYLKSVLQRFAGYPLVVEVRHRSWNAPEVLDLLREFHAGICNIDQPIIGKSLEPAAEVTSPVGYVRLHGRRYDTWFSDDPKLPQHERYNYLYSREELQPWAERIERVAERARSVFVITNNHYLGKAVVNALELISILKHTKVDVPPTLRKQYPQLESIATESSLGSPAPEPEEPTLFPLGKKSTDS